MNVTNNGQFMHRLDQATQRLTTHSQKQTQKASSAHYYPTLHKYRRSLMQQHMAHSLHHTQQTIERDEQG